MMSARTTFFCKGKLFALAFLLGVFQSTSLFCVKAIPIAQAKDDKSNELTTTENFSFSVSAHAASSSHFYVGAHPSVNGAGQAKDYAVSYLLGYQFAPLLKERVKLNSKVYESDQVDEEKASKEEVEKAKKHEDYDLNPLFDKGIRFLKVPNLAGQDRPLIVTADKDQRASVYMIRDVFSSRQHVLAAENIRDANGEIASDIAGLEGYNIPMGWNGGGYGGAFVAVCPSGEGSVFGDFGSGIAWLDMADKKIETEKGKKSITRLTQWEVQNSVRKRNAQMIKKRRRNQPLEPMFPHAVSLDRSSEAVAIKFDLASMGNIVAMHWSPDMKRLYLGLQVQGTGESNAGAIALAMCRMTTKSTLKCGSFVPSSAFTAGAQDEIVGGIGANTQASIHDIKTLRTSTGLHYLIVHGGNGDADATRATVYALPLVSEPPKEKVENQEEKKDDDVDGDKEPCFHGCLASKNAKPDVVFSNDETPIFQMRAFREAAHTPEEVTRAGDSAAGIGGGLSIGVISEIFVDRDTVFAAVSNADGKHGGIFYSTALFDEDGKIKAWTIWRRATTFNKSVFGGMYEPHTGIFFMMPGEDKDTVCSVMATAWGSGDENGLGPLVKMLQEEFSKSAGGIQGVFDFPAGITTGLHRASLLVATGHNKIAIIESGRWDDQYRSLIQNTGSFVEQKQDFTDGSLASDVNTKVVTVSGGDLALIGAITCAEVSSPASYPKHPHISTGRLFVGGVNGVAVLAQKNGDSWWMSNDTCENLNFLSDTQFKKVGDYHMVRKLVADNGFLYVLTDKKLDRIDLSLSNFVTGELCSTTIAEVGGDMVPKNITFSDCLVSEKFALLGTSRGLFRVGNGADIRAAKNNAEVAWTQVPINEGMSSVMQLSAQSVTGRAQDVACVLGGMIHVVNGHAGKDRSQINRFSIRSVDGGQITDETLQPIPDIRVKGRLSYYCNVGLCAKGFETDGSLRLYYRGKKGQEMPFVKNATAQRSLGNVTLPLGFDEDTMITRVLRSSSYGSWLVCGDSVHVCE